jgi:hypothetical protein
MMSNVTEPKTCAHCGTTIATAVSINGADVCHTDWKVGVPLAEQDDCYRLITVYGEPLGVRQPGYLARVDFFAALDDEDTTPMLINLTPHPLRIYPQDTPDRIDPADHEPECVLPPAETPARIGENYLSHQTLPNCPLPVAYIEYRASTGLPPWTGTGSGDVRTWYVVSLALALAQAGRRPDLLVPSREVRNLDGTVIGCRELALPV